MPEIDSLPDLEPRYLEMVKDVLRNHIPSRTVWLYGSRTNGTACDSSDIDLVFFASENENTDELTLQVSLKEAFRESPIPLFVDILSWDVIPDSFKEVIKSQYYYHLQ